VSAAPNSFRADHVGSLTRPPALTTARAAFRAGELSREQLREVEDRAILDALDQQLQAAMPILSDGEFRRDADVRDDWREALQASGLDAERELLADIAAENACWDLLAPEQTVRAIHMCRGSRTEARGSGGYEWLAERLFDQLRVDRFLLEYDSELVGGFEPLRFLPKGKTVVLGLVTSKDPRLESEDDLLCRIESASRYAPLDQLAISPQCGFGGSADNAFMTPDEQWRKLELVARVADRAWGSS
jgi:methionine synthase II (cobalamin-independent)